MIFYKIIGLVFLRALCLFSGSSDGLSLSSRSKLLTVLWVGSAFLSIAFTPVAFLAFGSAGQMIEDAGSLKMQVYRLAYMASVRTPMRNRQPNQRIWTYAGQCNEKRCHSSADSVTNAAGLRFDQSMLLIDWESNIKPSLQHHERPTQIGLYRFAGNIKLFYRRWKTPTSKILCGCAVFKWRWCWWFLVAAGLMIVLALFIGLSRPLEKLRDRVETISEGRFGVQIDTDQIRGIRLKSAGFQPKWAAVWKRFIRIWGTGCPTNSRLGPAKPWFDPALPDYAQPGHQTFTPQRAAEEFLAQILPAFSALGGTVYLPIKNANALTWRQVSEKPKREIV